MDSSVFNSNRYIALFLGLIIAVIGWYATILLTAPYNKNRLPKPNKKQVLGLGLAFAVSVLWWGHRCYTIIPHK
jgi:hypothetical protein